MDASGKVRGIEKSVIATGGAIMNGRYVKTNAHGRWSVYEEKPGGDVWLIEFENESHAKEFAAVPLMHEALSELLEWERKLGGWDAKVWRTVERIVWNWPGVQS